MKKSTKLFATALTLFTVAATATGCGGKKGTADKILIWVGTESVDFYTAKLKEFEADYNKTHETKFPGVTVKGVDTGSAADTFKADTEAGADIFTIAHDNLAKLTEGALIAPITDQALEAQVRADNPDSFYNVCRGVYEGSTYTFAVPYISQALVLYYNKTLVSAEQAKSFEGLREAARAAGSTVRAMSYTGTDGYNFSWPILARKTADNSTTVKIYENGEQSNCFFTGDDTVSISKWCQEYFASENGASFPSSDGWERDLLDKRAVSVIGGAWNLEAAKGAMGGEANVGVTILPTFKMTDSSAYGSITSGTEFRAGTFADCKAFVMKRTSKIDKSLLQEVVKFLSSKEIQEQSFAQCGNLPAYKNAATEFESMKGDDLNNQLARAQIEMGSYGISQPFGVQAKYNTYYYSKGAPDLFKELIENKDNAFGTFDLIKARLQTIENIWKTGKQ